MSGTDSFRVSSPFVEVLRKGPGEGVFCNGSVRVYGCFFYMLKIETITQIFSLMDAMIGTFCWLFLWNFKRLYHRKWLMLFSLKFQRNNRQNTLAVNSAKGKTGEKTAFSPRCGDETTTYGRAFLKFQRNNQIKCPQLWSPSAEKLEKKAVFSAYC